MNNKVLIKVILPNIESEYDVFIPVNEQLWRIEKLTIKCIYDLLNMEYNPKTESYIIINKITGQIYDKNQVILDTDIRNATELYFVKEMEEQQLTNV